MAFVGVKAGRLKEAEFYIGINGFKNSRVNGCITARIKDEQESIDLSKEDQEEIWDILDVHCRDAFEKGCEQMLDEAKALI